VDAQHDELLRDPVERGLQLLVVELNDWIEESGESSGTQWARTHC
jgi:hypothetical protein